MTTSSVADSFAVVEADYETSRLIVNPKRGPTSSVPDLDAAQSHAMAATMFRAHDMPEYAECITAETKSRAIPFAFKQDEVKPLTDLYIKWLPVIMKHIFREITPPTQAYNKVSRLGHPYFKNPLNKMTVLRGAFAELERNGPYWHGKPFIVINVRLQPEPPDKLRKYMFVTDDNRIYEKDIDRRQERVEVKGVGPLIPSRVRQIFNMPVANLYKQVFDTAAHKVMLKRDSFSHNMFARMHYTGKYMIALDVKHFERYIAEAMHARSQFLGGLYAKIGQSFRDAPFLVPTDSWDNYVYLHPNRANGWSVQYASGDSQVAGGAKELMSAIYAEYFRVTRRMSEDDALSAAWNGGDGSLVIDNYGDDNVISGTESDVKACYKFVGEYIPVEEEDPKKFLGFIFSDERKQWELGRQSYLFKSYLSERAPFSNFRKFPFLGWREKRKVYTELGEPFVSEKLFPFENALLSKYGVPWSEVLTKAAKEELRSRNVGLRTDSISRAEILEKTYLMTEQQKLASGMFWGMDPLETGPIIKRLIDPAHLKHSSLRD